MPLNNIPPLHERQYSSAKAHILVFDSGVGGLSIVAHLRTQLPHASISYLADNEHFPYGTLQPQQLTERVEGLLCQLSRAIDPDLIVVACNTASTLALPALRSSLAIPIVGVVPAIKPAAQITASKVIGLIATPGTISRDYTDELINEFASELTIIRLGSTELVRLVEDLLPVADALQRGSATIDNKLNDELNKHCHRILRPLLDHPQVEQMDTVVLACTHFPLIQQQLAAALPQVKHWIDSGDAVARRVVDLLDDRVVGTASTSSANTSAASTSASGAPKTSGSAYLTKPQAVSERLIEQYRRFGFSNIEAYPKH